MMQRSSVAKKKSPVRLTMHLLNTLLIPLAFDLVLNPTACGAGVLYLPP